MVAGHVEALLWICHYRRGILQSRRFSIAGRCHTVYACSPNVMGGEILSRSRMDSSELQPISAHQRGGIFGNFKRCGIAGWRSAAVPSSGNLFRSLGLRTPDSSHLRQSLGDVSNHKLSSSCLFSPQNPSMLAFICWHMQPTYRAFFPSSIP